jgi:hypothetical protein
MRRRRPRREKKKLLRSSCDRSITLRLTHAMDYYKTREWLVEGSCLGLTTGTVSWACPDACKNRRELEKRKWDPFLRSLARAVRAHVRCSLAAYRRQLGKDQPIMFCDEIAWTETWAK